MRFMLPKQKLHMIRDLRKIRDELLKTDNLGRAMKLVTKLPDVESVKTGYEGTYQLTRTVIVKLVDGHVFTSSGYGEHLDGLKTVGEHIYLRFIPKL